MPDCAAALRGVKARLKQAKRIRIVRPEPKHRLTILCPLWPTRRKVVVTVIQLKQRSGIEVVQATYNSNDAAATYDNVNAPVDPPSDHE